MKKIITLTAMAVFALTSVQSFACGDHDHNHGKKKTIITEATKTKTTETKK